MATGLPSNIYSGGAVVLNTQPLATMYQQYAAHRQAKEDALDNYFRDLGKNITPGGMRSQDVEGLLKRTNESRQYYIQNKQAILHPELDNGKAYNEYMGRNQDQLAYIDRSKNRLKTTDEVGKIKLDPSKSWVLDDPEFMHQFSNHDLPLDDPNSKELNLMQFSTPPKPWDIKDQEAYLKYRTSGLKKDEIYGQTQFLPGFKTSTPVTSQYSADNLRVIGERGKAMYDMDRSLQFETNKLMKQIERDPARQQQLNSLYKNIYGRDIQSPRDLRAAQDILEESAKSIEYKPGEDTYGREKALEAIRFGHQKELKKADQAAADSWIDNYWQTRISGAKSGQPTPLHDPDNPLTIKMGYEIQPDAVMMKSLARNGIEPDRVYVTDNNKILPIFYHYKEDFDEKGKKIGTSVKTDAEGNPEMDKDLSKSIDLDQAYLSMGYKGETKKQLSGTMTGTYKEPGSAAPKTEKHPLPAGKPRTVKQGGFTYTWNSEKGTYE